jgi:hypothetical protein
MENGGRGMPGAEHRQTSGVPLAHLIGGLRLLAFGRSEHEATVD